MNARTKGSLLVAAIVVGIVIVSSILVMNTFTSSFKKSQAYTEYAKARDTVAAADTIMRELALEASGSRRLVKLTIDNGIFEVSGKEDKLKFRLEHAIDLFEPGSILKEGNVKITASAGGLVKAYEEDINGDGTTELVLENDAILFAVKKVGSSSNWAPVNLTSIIPKIRNKRASVDVTPIAGIFVEDRANTSYGVGYTELTAIGTVQSGGIRIFVNATGSVQYEAIFTLQASHDFLEMEVRNYRRI